jgi:hypothetical protein
MKFPRLVVFLLFAILSITLTVESVFSLPIASMMILLFQQTFLTEEESGILVICCGIVLAILYQLPFAFGIGVFAVVTLLGRSQIWKTRINTRNAFITLLACSVLFVSLRMNPSFAQAFVFGVHFVVVLVLSRFLFYRQRKFVFTKK